MKILLTITVEGTYFEREVDWPAVPRVGEEIELTARGWSEEVSRVWWRAYGADTRPTLEVGSLGGPGVRDAHGEGLADDLRAHGWSSG